MVARIAERPIPLHPEPAVNDEEPRIDREASDAIKRMERQQFLDGKLDKAYAAEGAGILFLPVVLAVVGVIGWAAIDCCSTPTTMKLTNNSMILIK